MQGSEAIPGTPLGGLPEGFSGSFTEKEGTDMVNREDKYGDFIVMLLVGILLIGLMLFELAMHLLSRHAHG
jgi:hypothetical protein